MVKSSLLIHPEELSKKWIDKLADAGVETLALHPVGGWRAYLTLAEMLEKLETPEYRALLDYAAQRGLKIEYEMHAGRYLLPAEHFEAHPEWFRMTKEGERKPDRNFCMSNEEALDFVAERAAELAKKLYRSTNRYFFWLDDGEEMFCHCDKCRKLTPSDQQLIAMNRIVRRLKKDNENATLAYLAYHETIASPTCVSVDDGIFLEYAPIKRSPDKPVSVCDEAVHLPMLVSTFGKAGAKVLDYWYDNSLYSNWTKPPKKFTLRREIMKEDFGFYKSLGFNDMSSFACYLGADYDELFGDADVSDFGALANE